MEAIMIPNMKLWLQAQVIPEEWQDLNSEWADQDTYGVAAQILLGADQATLFPRAVKDWTGSLLQVNQARLMQSEITGRYIIFGSCSRHKSHSKGRNTWVRSNQFQENELLPSSDEVLISIMGSISLDEVDNVEIGPGTDWLGVEQEVQACTITVNMDRNGPNGQDNDNQEDSDLLPFDPDY